jgi:nucleotide-binding universal stress UspA family protein
VLKKILIAVDSSEHANRAVLLGAEIASRFEAAVVVVHACPQVREEARLPGSGKVVQRLEENAQRVLAQARHVLWQHGVGSAELVYLTIRPVPAILRTCREHEVDLIVMGTRGLGAVSSAVLGGVSLRVARRAPCPVLLVR